MRVYVCPTHRPSSGHWLTVHPEASLHELRRLVADKEHVTAKDVVLRSGVVTTAGLTQGKRDRGWTTGHGTERGKEYAKDARTLVQVGVKELDVVWFDAPTPGRASRWLGPAKWLPTLRASLRKTICTSGAGFESFVMPKTVQLFLHVPAPRAGVRVR